MIICLVQFLANFTLCPKANEINASIDSSSYMNTKFWNNEQFSWKHFFVASPNQPIKQFNYTSHNDITIRSTTKCILWNKVTIYLCLTWFSVYLYLLFSIQLKLYLCKRVFSECVWKKKNTKQMHFKIGMKSFKWPRNINCFTNIVYFMLCTWECWRVVFVKNKLEQRALLVYNTHCLRYK